MKRLIYIALMAIVAVSCTEDIELELNDTYERLVVEGTITNEAQKHQVKLTKTGGYFSEEQTPRVSDAIVSISDGQQIVRLEENPDHPGIYETPADFKGIPGRTYTLNIDQVEINGKQESYSASSVMRKVSTLDSIELEHQKRFGLWFVNVYAMDPGETKDFYLFNVYLNNVLYSDTLSEVMVQSDEFFNGNYTYGITSQVLYDYDVEPGDTITFELAGITEDYYDFILELQEETGYSMPLFSGPPANVSTNISNGGLGFFTAYSVARASAVVK